MDDQLKNFTAQNREAFDLYEPSPELWNRVEAGLQAAPVKRMHNVRLRLIQFIAAAAVLVLAWFLVNRFTGNGNKQEPVAVKQVVPPVKNEPVNISTPEPVQKTDAPVLAETKTPQTNTLKAKPQKQFAEPEPEADPLSAYAVSKSKTQYVNRYFKKNVPEMHVRFSEDLAGLQQQYAQLEKELKKGINRSQILSAMQQNLEMQNELVNRQLNVIKEIKQIKNTNNEYYTRKIT